MSTRVAVRKNSYKDSVRLLEATRAILGSPGVSWGWALMATPANLETLAEQGIAGDADGAAANDLVLAVRADDDDSAAGRAGDRRGDALRGQRQGGGRRRTERTDLAGRWPSGRIPMSRSSRCPARTPRSRRTRR